MKCLTELQVSQVSGGSFSDDLSNYASATKSMLQKEWSETTPAQLAVSGLVGGAMILFGRPEVPLAVRAFSPVAVWFTTCILKGERYNVF